MSSKAFHILSPEIMFSIACLTTKYNTFKEPIENSISYLYTRENVRYR